MLDFLKNWEVGKKKWELSCTFRYAGLGEKRFNKALTSACGVIPIWSCTDRTRAPLMACPVEMCRRIVEPLAIIERKVTAVIIWRFWKVKSYIQSWKKNLLIGAWFWEHVSDTVVFLPKYNSRHDIRDSVSFDNSCVLYPKKLFAQRDASKNKNLLYESLHEKCPMAELFLIRIFLDLLRKSPHSVRIQENTDQK